MKRLALASFAALALPLVASARDAPGVFKIPGTDSTIKLYGVAEANLFCELSGGGESFVRLLGAQLVD